MSQLMQRRRRRLSCVGRRRRRPPLHLSVWPKDTETTSVIKRSCNSTNGRNDTSAAAAASSTISVQLFIAIVCCWGEGASVDEWGLQLHALLVAWLSKIENKDTWTNWRTEDGQTFTDRQIWSTRVWLDCNYFWLIYSSDGVSGRTLMSAPQLKSYVDSLWSLTYQHIGWRSASIQPHDPSPHGYY